MIKKTFLKVVYFLTIAAVILPAIGFAATAAIRAKRSDTYLMGAAVTGVPYYVYGYDIGVNATGVATAATAPIAPRLPIAGGGGKAHAKLTR
ncbi:MAG: hypothetical protein Q7S86_00125 [bacterium]|nr:hypothetical protein [bacterium]